MAVSAYVRDSLSGSHGFGNLCTSVCGDVAVAWESTAAQTWIEELDALGASIKSAFNSYGDEVQYMVDQEPRYVEVPGPQAWKAEP